MKKKILLWLCFLLGGVGIATAQQTTELRGRVTSLSGEEIVGAIIRLEGTQHATTSDSYGWYRLVDIPIGRQTLVVSSLGFQTQTRQVVILPKRGQEDDRHDHLNIVLHEATHKLQEVEVVGRRESSYKNTHSFVGTKTATALKDVPQSIAYVTKELILDQGATNVGDIIKNISGVSQYSGYNDVSIRGFRVMGNRSSGNMLNGLRAQTSLWKQMPLANIERVEVIKGPASALFGNASPGGIINRVTKKPLTELQRTVTASVGSFNSLRTMADFTGPLDKKRSLLYRLNLAYDRTDSYRDLQGSEGLIIAPSFSFVPSSRTSFNIDLVYQTSDGKIDRGQTIFGDGDLYSVPINKSLSAVNDYLKEKVLNVTLGLTHRLTDNISFNSSYLASSYDEDMLEHSQANDYVYKVDGTQDPSKVLMTARMRKRLYRNGNWSNYFNMDFATGAVKHKLLLGYDYFQTKLLPGSAQMVADGYLLADGSGARGLNKNRLSDYASSGVYLQTNVPYFDLNTYSGNAIMDISKYYFRKQAVPTADQSAHGLYLQEQIEWKRLKMLLGLRWEQISEDYTSAGSGTSKIRQTAILPRLGLVYGLTHELNLYATWVKGFEPQSVSVQANPDTGAPFDPETSELFELGAKGEYLGGRLSVTTALFHLTKQGTLYNAGDAGYPDRLIQIGEECSRGIELDVAGRILPNWSIALSYAYTDAKITKTATNSEKDFGTQRPNTPRHSGNLWTKYSFDRGMLRGLGFGLGYNFVTEREGQVGKRTTTVVYPAYGILNLAAYYIVNRKIQLQLNVNNLLNTIHWLGGYDKLRSFPGSPRHVQATISYRF